jgi:hypothetical protein
MDDGHASNITKFGIKKKERKKPWRKGGCNGMQAQNNQLTLGL